MEYSIDCVRSVLEMLNLNTIAPQDEEDEGKEVGMMKSGSAFKSCYNLAFLGLINNRL